MIKTFRGLMADNTQDTIVLHTNDGLTGYRIKKFQIFVNSPGTTRQESVIKIYTVSQTTQDTLVDFSDPTLLAVAHTIVFNATGSGNIATHDVIFDTEIFNQDVYVTHKDGDGAASACNYYIELEQIRLSETANAVATLKDIRNKAVP